MKKTTRKLVLDRTTVRPLAPETLEKIHGASFATVAVCTGICSGASCNGCSFQTCAPCYTKDHQSCPSCPC